MLKKFKPAIIIALLISALTGCATAPHVESSLEQGQRYFEKGYYKRSLELMLPLASKGNAKAQYAVGYMYYYGFGIEHDAKAGKFWIKRAADQGYQPAKQALKIMRK